MVFGVDDLVTAGIPLVGGFLGDLFGKSEEEKAAEQTRAALAEITGVANPSVADLQIALERHRSAGTLTPELEQFIGQEATKMNQVSTDPRLKDAQMASLGKLAQLGETGITSEDRLALGDVRRDVAREDQARQQSILQNMQSRGAGGSGAELAASLASSQAAAERSSQEGMQQSAMAQKRALEAIMQRGSMAGEMRGQDFQEQSAKAQAADAIARFNAQNRQSVAGANVNRGNRASEMNLGNAQDLMNRNTDLSNKEQAYNKELLVDDYNRKMDKARTIANIKLGQAKASDANAARTRQRWSDVGSGAGQAAASIFGKKPTEVDTSDLESIDDNGDDQLLNKKKKVF
jgi:hypothetical protein